MLQHLWCFTRRALRKPRTSVVCATLLLASSISASAQITSGTIFATVKDPAGAVISGAAVTFTDPTIGLNRTLLTDKSGAFIAADLPAGTYTVSVHAKGFQGLTEDGVVLDVGARLGLQDLRLSIGQVDATVTVSASGGALQLQTTSGERSEVIDSKQLENLMSNGRNVLDYLKVIPGINSTFNGAESSKGGLDSMSFNGTRENEHQISLDGVSNEDNGCNCGVQVTANTDAIQEAKVEDSNFQAEYGKAAGGLIAVAIKNGTNEFHGNLRYYYRHDWMNANDWFNDQTNAENRNTAGYAPLGTEKMRFNNYGVNLGGPVLLPFTNYNKHRDKLFFFYSQEYYQQTLPGGTQTVYVPTALEANGNFSQSKDGYGNPLTIMDPTTGLPFPGNQIPTSRILSPIQQIFSKIYPKPNAIDPTGQNRYNYQYETSYNHPRQEEIGRIDWQINPANRFFFRIISNQDSQNCPLGCDGIDGISNFEFPGGMEMKEPGYNLALDLTTLVNSSTVNEVTAGWSVNQLYVSSVNNSIMESNYGIQLPLLYNTPSNSPIPDFSFSGINNQTLPWTYLGSMPFNNALTTINFTDNLTKTIGHHTLKTGIFIERTRKDQSAWGNANGDFSFNGQDNEESLQTGDPFANALLGYYDTFEQSSNRLRGYYRYTNIDWYLQDHWQVTQRLTLDYGVRVPWFQPQYDSHDQTAVFNPADWVASAAPRLYRSNDAGGAYDPASPATLLPGYLAGTIVPNSGNISNGIELAKNGYYRGGFMDAGELFEPRFGFAYKLTSDGKTVLRGGAGITHDRLQGNPIYNEVTENPPNTITPELYYGTVQGLSSLDGGGTIAPSTIMGFDPSGKIATVYSYSLGVQRDLGKGMMLDVAYVGNEQRHLSQMRNLNAIPYGTTFQLSAQDPYKFGGSVPATCDSSWEPSQYKAAGLLCTGTNALPQVYLEPYQGYNNIQYYIWDGVANYNSLQVSVNRRFGHGLTFGGAYTWSKTMDTTDTDGSYVNTISEKKYNYHLAGFDRANDLAINYMYDLPNVGRRFVNSRLLAAFTDHWQISGISQFITGAPLGLGTNFSWWGGQMVDGSWTEPTAAYLAPGQNPVNSRHGRYAAYNPTAFTMPPLGTPPPWPQQYFRGGGTNDTDLTLVKRIPVGEKRYIELRWEAFNAFNHPQFYGRNTTATPDLSTDTSGANANNFWAWDNNWSQVVPVSPANIRPKGNKQNLGLYFGDYNSDGNNRVMELAGKFYF
jgi:hypothetical protein